MARHLDLEIEKLKKQILSLAADVEELVRVRHSADLDELPQPGVRIDQPEFRRRHAQLDSPGCDPDVARQRHLEADMVVMGSRGAGDISPALLGSKATAVIRATPVPVFVVTDRAR